MCVYDAAYGRNTPRPLAANRYESAGSAPELPAAAPNGLGRLQGKPGSQITVRTGALRTLSDVLGLARPGESRLGACGFGPLVYHNTTSGSSLRKQATVGCVAERGRDPSFESSRKGHVLTARVTAVPLGRLSRFVASVRGECARPILSVAVLGKP